MIRIKLPRTIESDLKALKSLSASRRSNTAGLSNCLNLLKREYIAYPNSYKTPTVFKDCQKSQPGEARLLNELYDRSVKQLAYVRKLRDSANTILQACPYCGLPGVLTLDHYLPRAKKLFPHFSVLTANLVPACMDCQHAKGDFYPQRKGFKNRVILHRGPSGPSNQRRLLKFSFRSLPSGRVLRTEPERILHPYFDNIFSTRTLRLVTSGSIKILAPSKSSYARIRVVQFHLSRLKMVERTALEVKRCLDYLIGMFQGFGVQTVPEARRVAEVSLYAAYRKTGHGGTVDILVRHSVVDDDDLILDLLQKSLAPQPRLVLESQVVELHI